MGNSQKSLKRKIKNLNFFVADKKFLELMGMKLCFDFEKVKESGKNKEIKVRVSAISGSENVKTVIGTCNSEKCEKLYNIVQHIISLDCSPASDSDSTCSICLENFADTIISCGHHFCLEDIISWASRNQECPLCRQPFSVSDDFTKVEVSLNDLKQEIRICKEELLNLIDY